MSGYGQGKYLMAKMTPLLMLWMFRKTATSPCFRSHGQRGEDVGDDPTRLMEESSQGPRRAFTIDVTRPLRGSNQINPTLKRLLLQMPVDEVVQL